MIGRRATGLYFLTLALLASSGCQRRQQLPVLRAVPGFELTSQAGETFGSDQLKGKIWIADFIYTTCPGPCPRMSTQMRRIQELTAKWPDVQLVSITINPDVDTPPVLAAYAKRYLADVSRWHFLTGKREVIHYLKRETFKLGDVTGDLEHSTRFVLIDNKMRVRAYYATMDADPVQRVVDDVRGLLEE